MAKTRQHIDAPPERVFAVLADAESYAYWVVGSDRIRKWDQHWPDVGARFYHQVGPGPIKTRDNTEVLASEPPFRLELHARARPFGTARITMLMEPSKGGTHVTMIEDAGDPLTKVLFLNPLVHWLTDKRNVEGLKRLKELAEKSPAAAKKQIRIAQAEDAETAKMHG